MSDETGAGAKKRKGAVRATPSLSTLSAKYAPLAGIGFARDASHAKNRAPTGQFSPIQALFTRTTMRTRMSVRTRMSAFHAPGKALVRRNGPKMATKPRSGTEYAPLRAFCPPTSDICQHNAWSR